MFDWASGCHARVLRPFDNVLRLLHTIQVVCSGCPAGGASERFAELLVERLHESVGMPLDLRHRGIGAEALFSLFIDTLYASFASREAHDRERLLASLDPHLSPISTMCLIPEGFGYDYVFKLEAMDEWYGGFLALTGLEDSAASGWHISSWLNVVGDPTEVCFYRPMGVHCADVQRLTNDCTAGNPSLAPFNTSSVASLNRQRLQQSANMSETKLHNFYTRELAAKVTQMYQQDLLRFGYPAWDGQSLYNPIQQF